MQDDKAQLPAQKVNQHLLTLRDDKGVTWNRWVAVTCQGDVLRLLELLSSRPITVVSVKDSDTVKHETKLADWRNAVASGDTLLSFEEFATQPSYDPDD